MPKTTILSTGWRRQYVFEVEDALQEAAITVYQVLCKKPEAPMAYLITAAKYSVICQLKER